MAIITGIIKKPDNTAFVGKVKFSPLSTPLADSPDIITRADKEVTTDGSGNFSVTLRVGKYAVFIGDDKRVFAQIPDDDGSYTLEQVITSTISATEKVPANITLAQWSDNRLKEMAEAGAYEMLAPAYDASRLTSSTVKWPDGSAGTLTVTAWSADGLPDAYTVTHTTSSKTITQSAVTRNANGDITSKPALTIS
ncbi:MAG: hypothetical protein Q7R45_01445 [Sulfuricaulis sp.]|nr:hypothetical protein [Sulfuricaulis sp.]